MLVLNIGEDTYFLNNVKKIHYFGKKLVCFIYSL